jgi:hypothetical protein
VVSKELLAVDGKKVKLWFPIRYVPNQDAF